MRTSYPDPLSPLERVEPVFTGQGMNHVGHLKVRGSGNAEITTVTGLDTWNATSSSRQSVSGPVAWAPTNGAFNVYTSGVNSTDKYLRAGTYDVNVQNGSSPVDYGYTNHTTWNNPGGDCMTWMLGVNTIKVGTVTYTRHTPSDDGIIDSAADKNGNPVTVSSGWAGPFSLPSGMTTSPGSYEQAVCISSSNGVNGNQAPLDVR